MHDEVLNYNYGNENVILRKIDKIFCFTRTTIKDYQCSSMELGEITIVMLN